MLGRIWQLVLWCRIILQLFSSLMSYRFGFSAVLCATFSLLTTSFSAPVSLLFSGFDALKQSQWKSKNGHHSSVARTWRSELRDANCKRRSGLGFSQEQLRVFFTRRWSQVEFGAFEEEERLWSWCETFVLRRITLTCRIILLLFFISHVIVDLGSLPSRPSCAWPSLSPGRLVFCSRSSSSQ